VVLFFLGWFLPGPQQGFRNLKKRGDEGNEHDAEDHHFKVLVYPRQVPEKETRSDA
jgi:hypothetical protein